MDSVTQDNPGDRTIDLAHFLHARRSERDFISDGGRVTIAHLKADVAALQFVGLVEVGYPRRGGERTKASAALMLIDQHPRHRIRLAAYDAFFPRCRHMPSRSAAWVPGSMNVNLLAAISAIVALVTPMFFGVRFRCGGAGRKHRSSIRLL
jgi:hypothetical protein